jgi:protein O-GlcNAc transferase
MIAPSRHAGHLSPAEEQHLEAAQSALQAKRPQDALVLLVRLRASHPTHIAVLANLAAAHRQSGDLPAALSALEVALLQPDAPAELWFNHANLLRDLKRLADAEYSYRKALELRPSLHQASTNLANLIAGQNRTSEAEALHRSAVASVPGNLPSLRALARLRFEAGDFVESEKLFRAALRLATGHPETRLGLGVALKELGRTDEAIGCWQSLLKDHPDYAAAHNNLGALLRLTRHAQEAVHHLRIAVRLAPHDAIAAANLSHALIDLGQMREAESVARRIVDADPAEAQGHLMLGFSQVYQGRTDEGLASLQRAHRCKPDSALVISNTLFASQYSAKLDGTQVLDLHRRLASCIEPAKPPRTHWTNSLEAGRRLRIGYLSPDLRSHPVSLFFEPILAHHAAENIEACCYSTTPAPDATTQRLRAHAKLWRDGQAWSDAQLVDAITADRIDILVDLAGHTAQNRSAVLRARPAPVQALYIGYPGTSGLPEVDYLITDGRVCPDGSEHLYSERLIRLDGSFWCYGGQAQAPAPAPPPCLANGHTTFGSFNALQKISDAVVDCWAQLLSGAPGSRLVLKSLGLAEQGTADFVRRRFAARGVDDHRIDLLPPSDPYTLLAEYRLLDIALDPFPYNGGTTTCDALWMGVPVVTLAGERFCGRMGASLLHSAGLPELVAADTASYLQAAWRLAGDKERLVSLRRSLRGTVERSPLGDARGAAQALERAYRSMWREWLQARGLPQATGIC